MRKFSCLIGLLSLLFCLFMYQHSYAGVLKWIRAGKYQTKVIDSGDQSESAGEGTFAYYYFDAFTRSGIDHAGWQLGTKEWTDDKGNLWPVKISGAPHGNSDEVLNTIPIPDADGIYIHRYYRNQPPTVSVDGVRLDEPFPMEGDEVAPDKIPGTADVMVESWINTSMGITIHQRVFGWSQKHHDDYILYDWTFENTGNIDADAEIELPNQVLKDVYFQRANNWILPSASRPWNSSYGEFPGDSLRIMYAYPQRSRGADEDDFGNTRSNGFLRRPQYIGEAILHADTSPDDATDNPAQPQMTAFQTAELPWIKLRAELNGPSDHALLYEVMKNGFLGYDGTPEMEGTYPGHHSVRLDERGVKFVRDFPWFNWRTCTYSSTGPYTLNPGDSFRIVWATVVGTISPEVAWKVGKEWLAGTCTWDGADDLEDYYPVLKDFPDLAPTDNDRNKDRWICTGKDSLFANAWAAQWAVRNNYNVPVPPPAPSVDVMSLPDKITISWGTESEAASDFAGYKVYRATGAPDYNEEGGVVVGKWTKIYECGQGTSNALTHSYDDTNADRGIAYFYYVSAFDDGSENTADVRDVGSSLESGEYVNRTTVGAHLTRSAGTLSSIRVVPNPFNVGAQELQFTGEPDKIMFMDLPPVCTIKIYSENGSLIKTLEHTNGSGDEAWGNVLLEHSTTETGQIVVSGIYIAHIETPDGESINVKFLIVR
ncbi:hypothetical protein JXQ31_00790 [candidate division KSB1 bacterium]|nr:hypothetical protein [candidate division KSB1 bacterium]